MPIVKPLPANAVACAAFPACIAAALDKPAASAACIACCPASAAAASLAGGVITSAICKPVEAIDNQSPACSVSPVTPLPAAMAPSERPPVITPAAKRKGADANKPLPTLVTSKDSGTLGDQLPSLSVGLSKSPSVSYQVCGPVGS